MRLGVLSDTHGYLDSRLDEAFAGVDAIIHAGDVGSTDILTALAARAPLYAVQGNNDVPLGGLGLPETLDIEMAGVRLHIVHEVKKAKPAGGTSVVVSGHSHKPVCEWREGVLYLNPGAAGRRGFHQLQTAALLLLVNGNVSAEPIVLGPRTR
jgi:putative phosphoesterase